MVVALLILGAYFAGVFTNQLNQRSSADAISVQTLSLDSSTSNLTTTVNVYSTHSSPLVRMNLYINGTYVGSWNYTTASAAWGCCVRMMRSWSNNTYSLEFTATPGLMPMMSRVGEGCCMAGRNYLISMIGVFQDGISYNSTAVVVAGRGPGMMP